MATRLTPAQKGFLLSLYDPEGDDDTYAECYRRYEGRTALALHGRGLVDFADEHAPHQGSEYFAARLTPQGVEAVEKLRLDT